MIEKFNKLFETNNNDTLGTALLKGATKGYLQGVLAAGLGLGVLAVGVMMISNDEESSEEEEKELNEQMIKDWEEIKANVEKQNAKVEAI